MMQGGSKSEKKRPAQDDDSSDSDDEGAIVRRNGLGFFDLLHVWMVNRIINFLEPADWCQLAVTSKCFELILHDEDLWKKLCKKLWKGNLWFRGSWKRTVLDRFKSRDVITAKRAPRDVPGMHLWYKKQYKEWRISQYDLSQFDIDDNQIDRRSGLSEADFIEQYEKHLKPVIITDAIDNWPAKKLWTYENFLKLYGAKELRAGSGFRMSVENYYQYMRTNKDASPLYMFDGKLAERAPEMLECFSIPKYFRKDYFAMLPDDDRPPYRWLMLGPARTGPAFHIDPYCTPAWNAIIFGRKKYPKSVNPRGAGDPDSEYYEAPRPIRWYEKYYDDLPAKERPLEFIHKEGETVYLPPGWWHQVINLEPTLAMTQNFVSLAALKTVWEDTKKDRSFHDLLNREVIDKHPEAALMVGRY